MSSCNCDELYVGNTMVVRLKDLTDDEGELISDATVTASLTETDGTPVVDSSIDLDPVSGTAGLYQGVLPGDLDIDAGTRYVLLIDADVAGVGLGHWEVRKTARVRAG